MTPHHQFDLALVARAQAGDPMALHALLTAVRPMVLRYCLTRLRSYAGGLEAADDATQETCLAVLDGLPRYRQQGSPFAAFVYGVAAHKVADAQRGFGRSPVLIAEVPDQPERSLNPEEQAISAAGVRAVHDLLARLPPRTRQVLLLRAAGLGAEAVGRRVDMSANAVRVAQHRGATRLRVLVQESEEHHELLDGLVRRPRAALVRAGGPALLG